MSRRHATDHGADTSIAGLDAIPYAAYRTSPHHTTSATRDPPDDHAPPWATPEPIHASPSRRRHDAHRVSRAARRSAVRVRAPAHAGRPSPGGEPGGDRAGRRGEALGGAASPGARRGMAARGGRPGVSTATRAPPAGPG